MIKSLIFFIFLTCAHANNNLELQKIQDYLNSINTMEAKILQIDFKNDNAIGMFYLSKPSKMRIEVKNKKSDILMVATNQFITYYDKEMDEISHIPTTSTPATLLMQKKINFDEFSITDFEEKNNIYSITFYRKKIKDEGVFTFVFKKEDEKFILQRIDRYEDSTQKAKISLLFTDVKINNIIDDKLFIIKDKRLYN